MAHDIYKYIFDTSIPFQRLEDTFALALLAVESLHEKSRARMDIRFNLDRLNRICVIDASTEAGRDLSRIFFGFADVEYGPDAIWIKRTLRLPTQEQNHG